MQLIRLLLTLLLMGWSPTASAQSEAEINKEDSLILQGYEEQIMRSYIEYGDRLSHEELERAFAADHSSIVGKKVTVAPDKSFTIYTLEVESCGAYCNSDWYAWVQYRSKGKLLQQKVELNSIAAIYRLPNRRYLVVDASWGRPASVYTVSCQSASILAFSDAGLQQLQIPFHGKKAFYYCQEMNVETETEPSIRYDAKTKLLSYHFGKNYLYSKSHDVDSLWQGQMRYVDRQFRMEKETVTVHDRGPEEEN